jgi:predicted MPP superfamily phosphohydrolase
MRTVDLQGVERLAAFSDIHANAQALESAVSSLHKISPDVVLVLGDMLSYGCEPVKVLDELSRLTESFDTRFVLGNHDEIYRNAEIGI